MEKTKDLQNIYKALERQNEIIQQMLDIMPKPASKFQKIMETVALFVGIFGIISVIEIIRMWALGG
ncbi:MAG: hypothetical protein FWG89_08175 [Treponema sp.]|nr:hypothetical protein [Treponema sp.]